MLSFVLRSDTAIEVGIRNIDGFVEMCHFIAENVVMCEQARGVELKPLDYQRATGKRFERVFDYMETHGAPRQKGLLRRAGL